MSTLEKSLTPRLNGYARTEEHLGVVREHARKTVAEFVRQWLMKEDHWREDRFAPSTSSSRTRRKRRIIQRSRRWN